MSEPPTFGRAPSIDDIAAVAQAAFEALPDPFRRMTGQVLFRVEEFATEEVLEALGIEDAFELTGLYQGVDLTHRSVFDPQPQPSVVFLYRQPILDEWVAHGEITLEELVTHVLVHEIGHHFGLSDEAIESIEARAG